MQPVKQPTKQPTKQQVRDYMGFRVQEHKPPPSGKDIRRILGWHLK